MVLSEDGKWVAGGVGNMIHVLPTDQANPVPIVLRGHTQEIDNRQTNFFYFNSASRLARKRRSGSFDTRVRAFSYEARASGIRPNLRHRSARAECAR